MHHGQGFFDSRHLRRQEIKSNISINQTSNIF